jgi:hypothetical protein
MREVERDVRALPNRSGDENAELLAPLALAKCCIHSWIVALAPSREDEVAGSAHLWRGFSWQRIREQTVALGLDGFLPEEKPG